MRILFRKCAGEFTRQFIFELRQQVACFTWSFELILNYKLSITTQNFLESLYWFEEEERRPTTKRSIFPVYAVIRKTTSKVALSMPLSRL